MKHTLWILPTVKLSRVDNDAILYDSSKEIRIASIGPEITRLIQLLDGTHGDEILDTDLGTDLVSLLDQQQWLVRLQSPLQDMIDNAPEQTRQLSYFSHINRDAPDRVFDEVKNSRVLIVGTGGIGSYLAYHLAASGVKHFILNDPDRVEASNMNRQVLFCRSDFGRLKVDCLADALESRFEKLHIETVPVITDYDLFQDLAKQVDLVAICGETTIPLDHPEVVGDKPILCAGYFGSEVFVGPVVSPAHGTPPWSEVLTPKDRGERSALAARDTPLANNWNCSGAQINGMGGALIGETALRLLAPSLGGPILLMTRRFVDMKTLTMRDEVVEYRTARAA